MPQSLPNLPSIRATDRTAPPKWALLERQLITLMEGSAAMMSGKYAERSGAWYFYDDVDDYYERTYNWCLLYAMGGDESLVDLALKHWNATTRLFDPRHNNRGNHLDYPGNSPRRLRHSIHNEYFSLANPGTAEWHHMGEGNMAFYDLGIADPTISENARRARRFADMFIGEDEEAPNYDPVHKVLRSPMHGSQGPWSAADVDDVRTYLQGGHARDNPDWTPQTMGVRASLYPAVKELEESWWADPQRADEVVALFNKIVLGSDSAANLAATGLVTNAYLYTGDDKYKCWVLEYVEAWMDRIRQNGGIIPDNVGPTGKPGELRDGIWWGTIYGWNSYVGWSHIFHSITVAAECALLLSGDSGYLDLLRSQIQMLLDHSITDARGALLVPSRVTPDGFVHGQVERWDTTASTTLRLYELAHLYHASMSAQDYDLIARVRDGDVERDWNEVGIGGARAEWDSEYSRFQYYDGNNPDWPEKALALQYERALAAQRRLQADERPVAQIIADNQEPENPVSTKVLTQVMLGAPQSMYHGGLLRATVRYFDADRMRPGLPLGVAALVDELRPDGAGLRLVNTSADATRRVVVQAGAFGEHVFTEVQFERGGDEAVVPVKGKYFLVELAPSTSIRLDAGMQRFAHAPSYGFPWHGGDVPIPFA